MVDVPMPTVVAVAPFIVATAVLLEDQVACAVMSPVEPSEYVADAVNDAGSPLATLGLGGFTLMVVIAGGVTVTAELASMPPKLADTVAGPPAATPATRPVESTLATDGRSLDQVALTFGFEPSE